MGCSSSKEKGVVIDTYEAVKVMHAKEVTREVTEKVAGGVAGGVTRAEPEVKKMHVPINGRQELLKIRSPKNTELCLHFDFRHRNKMPHIIYEDVENLTLYFVDLKQIPTDKEIQEFLDNLPVGLKKLTINVTLLVSGKVTGPTTARITRIVIRDFPETVKGELMVPLRYCNFPGAHDLKPFSIFKIENLPPALEKFTLRVSTDTIIFRDTEIEGIKVPDIIDPERLLEYFALSGTDIETEVFIDENLFIKN